MPQGAAGDHRWRAHLQTTSVQSAQVSNAENQVQRRQVSQQGFNLGGQQVHQMQTGLYGQTLTYGDQYAYPGSSYHHSWQQQYVLQPNQYHQHAQLLPAATVS